MELEIPVLKFCQEAELVGIIAFAFAAIETCADVKTAPQRSEMVINLFIGRRFCDDVFY